MQPSPFTPICQSCGMPMKADKDFGTNQDKTINQEYCTHCYQAGQYTAPDITLDQMTKGCVGIMTQFGVPEMQAKQQMETLLPTLKRWKR
ncbi:MAG: zinc ribbon domain-containing protein [Patescibacteria group bacterium]|jgi:hypothetical protein